MGRETFICVLVLMLGLVAMAWLGGCSEEPTGGPVGPDKAYLGNQPDPESLVDTYILNGELDGEFPEDQQVYPYYIVRHGPEAGVYSFAEGDTVPDGAYVVLKARATTEEPTPQRFNVQGQFTAGAPIRVDGIWFQFATTYSLHDLKPGWNAPHRGLAADTLGFEVGPFRYDVAMRGILNLGEDEIYRDLSPDSLTFHGNFPPCVQCVELGNIDTEPTVQYEDPCYDQTCLDDRPVLEVYDQYDPRYSENPDPYTLRVFTGYGSNPVCWVRANEGQITFDEPVDPSIWKAIPVTYYAYLVYLHGKDHPREHWPDVPTPGRGAHERIKAWRYQIDYEQDVTNAINDGGGADDIDVLSGFNVYDNEPDPWIRDIYIIENAPDPEHYPGTPGAWALRVKVGVPIFLLNPGRDTYWSFLRVLYAVSPPPPPGSPDEDVLAWQAEPATQEAYQAWKLTTMQFSPGTIQTIAADNATCNWRIGTNTYHYYWKTRIPGPNGRRCEDGAYSQPPDIVEQGTIDLEDVIADSNDRVPVVKEFDLELYPRGDADPFTPGEDPPGWMSSRSLDLSSRASRF